MPMLLHNTYKFSRVALRWISLCMISGFVLASTQAQVIILTPPADVNALCQYVPPIATLTATSTCPGVVDVSVVETRQDGSCLYTYTLTRTWTATDACGDVARHTQLVNVSDTQAPILAGVPPNATVTPGNEPPPPAPRAIDFCDAAATLTTVRDSVPGPCGGYSLIYQFSGADACGNMRNATYVLSVTDDIYPTIHGVTPGARLNCGDPLPAAPNVNASDNGAPPTLTLYVDTLHNRGGDTCAIVIRTWTATDDCGNSATAQQSFSFHDSSAPVLAGIPADTIIYCEALPPEPILYADITASDNCDTYPGIQYVQTSTQTADGTCTDVTYVITRTWTALDECGNSASASQQITMKCECCFNGIDDDDDGLVDDYDPQCNCFSGVQSECDSTKLYFVPPVLQPNRGLYNQPSELVITTLATVANVHIATADGTTFNQTFQVFKGTPTIIPLTIDELQTPNHDQIESNKGWIITSDQLIQPIYRIDAFYNKVLVTIKGPQAMGRVFRAGSQTNTCGRNNMTYQEGHFISVMATEDNTEVTIEMTFPGLNGLNGTVVRTLNRGQSYMIRDDQENTTVSGSLITATKPIVVTSGSQHTKACDYVNGTYSGNVAPGMDGGIDQLVPNCLTGNEYVLVRGKGNAMQQYAVLVANKNNTRVVVDGDTANPLVLNAGESTQYWLDGRAYQPFHFLANKPFYMYHVSGISGNNEVGMAIAAPVGECKGDTLIEFPKFASTTTSSLVDNSVYTILPNAGLASLQINGQPYSTCASAVQVAARPDLSVVTFNNSCLLDNNVISSDNFFTAGMLVGIDGETGTHGYLTAFKDRMSVYRPGTNIITTGYLIDTLCGNQTVSHCVDVSSCATSHSIAAIRNGAGTVTIDSNTCFTYTSPDQFQGEDEVFVTLQNDQGLFQTVCLRYYICAEPPTLTFPYLDTTVNCNSIPPLDTPSMSDECNMNVTFQSEEVIDNGTCDYAFILYRNWTVWDDCGDSTIATQTIRVQDTTAPQALNIPSDTIVSACEGIPPIPTITWEENCDNTYQTTFSQETLDSTCIYNRTIVRRWEASDRCGNTSISIQRIELRDTSGPVISGVPPDEVVSCTASYGFPIVTVSDDCDPNPSLSVDSTVIASVCDTIHHVLRIWTATDACGQVTTATQRVLFIDLDAPVILNAPRDTTINCGEPLPAVNPVFVDDCTNPVAVYSVDSVVTGSCPIVSTIFRRWVATDDCGRVTSTEQVIQLVDSVGPQFVPLADTIYSSCLDSQVVIEPNVLESCDLSLTFTDSIAAGGNCNAERFLYRTYTATDNCGRVAQYTQLYYFQDVVPPYWVNGPRDTLLQCDEAIPPPFDPTVADACSGLNPIALVVRDSQQVCPARRWIIREYTVSDWCGNLSEFTQTITIDGCEPAIPVLATAEASCVGENIILRSAVDSGYNTPVYQWQYSVDSSQWTDLNQPVDSATLSILNARTNNSGYYRVIVADNVADLADAACSSTSAGMPLTVREPAATAINIDLCRGDTLFYLGDTLTQNITRTDSLQNQFGCDSIATLQLSVYPFVDYTLDTVLCFGESITVFGQTYISSGRYRDTLVTSYGCDTAVLLNLLVLPDLRDTTRRFICEGSSVTFEGSTYTSAGTYSAPFTSREGCDSTRVLLLNDADTARTRLDTILCVGEVLHAAGETFSSSGTYVRTINSSVGCDSTIAIQLSYSDTSAQQINVRLCFGEVYHFGSQLIRTAGSYRQSFVNQYGCDSNVVANVTMSPTYDVEIREELCTGEIYTNNGYSFSTAGRWPMQFYTADGCDSTIYVTLIYRPVFEVTVDTTICEGASYNLLDTLISTAGTYQRLGQSRFGCDSLVTLHLAVQPLQQTYLDTTLCFGESIQVGPAVLSSTGRDTIAVRDAFGCDSIIYVNLVVREQARADTTGAICAGETFVAGGRDYTQAGIYRDTSTSASGCDSIYTVFLTVLPNKRDTLEQSICMGDTLTLDGIPFHTAGEHILDLQTAFGCDSIVVLWLEVRDTAETIIDTAICAGSSYVVGQQTFDQQGTYEVTLQTHDGCDSTVVLNLEVIPESYQEIDTLLCFGERMVYGNYMVANPGLYHDTLMGVRGCDSIVGLRVSYREAKTTQLEHNICSGDSMWLAGAWQYSSASYVDTFSAANGCDSVVITHLRVRDNYLDQREVELCFGDSYIFGDQSINSAGIYKVSYTSRYGCDSTIELHATVIPPIRMAVDDVRMCYGASAKLVMRGYNGHVWWTPAEGLSCSSCPSPTVRAEATTRYTAHAVDCHGDTITTTATVTIDDPVNVSIIGNTLLRLGEQTTLVAVADNPTATMTWREGGDILCEGCAEVDVMPLLTTDYEVEARTDRGCHDRERLTLLVEDDCTTGNVFVPNIVTPNGDGYNDELEIRYEGVSDLSLLRIYGRWGELIYETRNVDIYWNGTHHGDPVNPGVFVYYLSGHCLNGDEFTKQGNVTVVR